MHPIKDATGIANTKGVGHHISIHAPYKGCNETQDKVTDEHLISMEWQHFSRQKL